MRFVAVDSDRAFHSPSYAELDRNGREFVVPFPSALIEELKQFGARRCTSESHTTCGAAIGVAWDDATAGRQRGVRLRARSHSG